MNSLNIPAPHADAAIEALRADGPLPAYREQLMLFGQFVGTWNMDISFYDEAGQRVFQGVGEWMFSWILDGRAIQDVLIYADISDPTKIAIGERRIGTTLRYYDEKLDAWRMVWLGATSGTFLSLIAKPHGSDILIEGLDMDGSFLHGPLKKSPLTGFIGSGSPRKIVSTGGRNRK